jgi:hypothetical protein
MQDYLSDRNIPYCSTMFKLYKIIKNIKPKFKAYKVESLLEQHGHSVLHLPPYHLRYNLIELISGLVKSGLSHKMCHIGEMMN